MEMFESLCSKCFTTKNLRVIKITVILLFGSFIQVSFGFSQSVTLKVKNAPLQQVLADIKKQTGYTIFYNAELLAGAKPVTLNVQNTSLPEVLNAAFNGQPLNYVIENKTVFISRSSKNSTSNKGNLSLDLLQAVPIKIRVTDDQGQPLSGATVMVKSSKKSGFTDAQGNITLSVEGDDIVTVSYVGYLTREIKVSDTKNSLVVVLPAKENINDEVVVMAYGQKKKKTEIMGSAVQINADRIVNMPAGRVDAILEGQLPGLRLTPNNDDASSTKQRLNIRIRGTGSFSASNEPIWIVDGTPVYTGDRTNLISGIQTGITPLSYINPSDIESITVLKDAAAAAIYGADASNGVILITTKSGKKGKPRLSLSMQTGLSHINKSTAFKTLDAAQYLELAKESYINAGKDMASFPYNDNDMNTYSTTSTNWMDEYYGTGNVNNANLSWSGGTEKLRYMLSGGYYADKSTIKGNTQNRASTMGSISYKINKKLEIGLITRYSYNKNNTFNMGSDYLDFLPIFSPYNNDGSYRQYNKKITGMDVNGNPIYTDTKFFNSVAEREENDDIQNTHALNNNIKIDYELIKGLKSTTQYGMDYSEIQQDIYRARTNWTGKLQSGDPLGYARKYYNNTLRSTFIERLTYSKSFGFNNVLVLGGLELNSSKVKTRSILGEGFDDDEHRDVNFADTITSRTKNKREIKKASYFGQIEYNFDQRYFAQVTARRDGSSTFGSSARWGDFAAVGIGWNIKNDLLKENSVIDNLRINATYGNTGNSRLSTEQSQGVYSSAIKNNYAGDSGAILSRIPNAKLRWETAYQTNLKLDFAIYDRLSFLIEAYRKKTVQAIVDVPTSRASGATSAESNTGELINQGIEVTVRWDVIKKRDKGLSWWVELNGAHNDNKALLLYNANDRTNGNFIWREGYDINTYYLIRWAGVDPRDGAPLWYDVDGNITRVYSIDNRVPWKSANPIIYGGFRTELNYKNISLSALFSYTLGGTQFSSFSRNINSDGLNLEADNQSVNQIDRWQQAGDISINPKPIWGVSTRSTMNSTRFVYKTTNLRLTNLVLGYNLTESANKRLGIKGGGIHLIANELGFWTPYDKSNRNSFKQSRSGYPMESSYLLSFNITF